MATNVWKWLEVAKMTVKGWKWLEINGYYWNGWKGLEMAGKGQKRLEMDKNGWNGLKYLGHFFVLWYWIDVSPAMIKMLISKEIVDGK